MNHSRYKNYIVVDENFRPMAFDKDQFCYCNSEKSARPFPLQSYRLGKAKKLIKQTIAFRKEHGFGTDDERYILMPIGKKL